MRIIAGEFRSRRLLTPRDASVTRPMPDRVRVSLFSLLRGHCEGATVFDGFAGTGCIGLEALSRGAARCVFVERDRTVADILRRNIEALGVENRAELIVGDALGRTALARSHGPLTLAFLDPPYSMTRERAAWERVAAQLAQLVARLADDGFTIVRTPWPLPHAASLAIDGAEGPETHVYHSTAVHLFMRARRSHPLERGDAQHVQPVGEDALGDRAQPEP